MPSFNNQTDQFLGKETRHSLKHACNSSIKEAEKGDCHKFKASTGYRNTMSIKENKLKETIL